MLKEDNKYLQIVLDPIRVSARYKPKFGQGSKGSGVSLEEFQTLYRADPFCGWFGLDNPLMYAAHKAAGGMTSVYRQIGIGCERLFRAILRDAFDLTDEEANWSYAMPIAGGRTRRLHLDGRVLLDKINDTDARQRFHDWMRQSAEQVDVDPDVFSTLKGAVFEVRQGYKSKDAKRQNADIANAAAAYTQAYLPCVVMFSSQIDKDILLRYRAEKWSIITGVMDAETTALISTYDFVKQVIGYDLAAFFERNQEILKNEVDAVLKNLLAPL